MRLDLGLNLGIYNRLEQSSLVLDILSTQSSAAYSLRKLRSAYTGSAIRVRRSQDNAEADIGFTSAGELDQTALLNHVGYENVFPRSEEFNNGAWVKGTGATITANATTDPLGGNTADRYNTISAVQNFIYQSISTSGIKTQSIYAKQDSNRYLWIYGGMTGSNYGALFDLQNGVVVTTNTNGTPTNLSNSITNIGNGWYRCSITYLPSPNTYQAFSSTNNPTPTYSANNDITNGTVGNIFIWGAQLQNSGILQPYQQTVATAWTSPNGFISTWYDQSGNGYNVTQATAASQPQIVTAGVVNLENGKPDIDFAGTKWLFNTAVSANASLWGGNPQTMNVVARTPNTADGDCFAMLGGTASATNLRALGGVGISPWRYTTGLDIANNTIGRNTFSIATGIYALSNANSLRTNGVQRLTGSGTTENTTAGNLTIGARTTGGANPWLGIASEVILFNTNITNAQALQLEQSQGQYYSITTP